MVRAIMSASVVDRRSHEAELGKVNDVPWRPIFQGAEAGFVAFDPPASVDYDYARARLWPGVFWIGQVEPPGSVGALAVAEVALEGDGGSQFVCGWGRSAKRGRQEENAEDR